MSRPNGLPPGSYDTSLVREYDPSCGSGRGVNADLNELREMLRNPPAGIRPVAEALAEPYVNLRMLAYEILYVIARLHIKAFGAEKEVHLAMFHQYSKVFARFKLTESRSINNYKRNVKKSA